MSTPISDFAPTDTLEGRVAVAWLVVEDIITVLVLVGTLNNHLWEERDRFGAMAKQVAGKRRSDQLCAQKLFASPRAHWPNES